MEGFWGDPYTSDGIELPEAFADPFAKPSAGSEAAPLLWPLETGGTGEPVVEGGGEVRPGPRPRCPPLPAPFLPRPPRLTDPSHTCNSTAAEAGQL